LRPQHLELHPAPATLKGRSSAVVEAVMRALLHGWKTIVVMDWSDDFWEAMHKQHGRLVVM
jgi:hypothetical protein